MFAQQAAQAAVNPQLDRVVASVERAKRLSQSSAQKRKAENRVGPWRLGRTLGRGSTGRVRLAKNSTTGQLAAIKIIPKAKAIEEAHHSRKQRLDENGLPYGIEREIIIMKLISHPNIMGLYDVWENKSELYLVLEYVEGGELFDYLISHGRLSEAEAARYFGQIIDAVAYCHKFQICHRDLKPENILLDGNGNIKIADFGMAALETRQRLLETSCGSPHYASPEIVAGKSYHGSPSDVWSCGVILFALLSGHLPFDDPNIRTLLTKVQSGRYLMPQGLSFESRDLISRMLRVNPRQRIPIDQVSGHPFMRKYRLAPTINPVSRQLASFDTASPVPQPADDILHNLQTLWQGTPREAIVAKLNSRGSCPEKIFYHLLENYKLTHRGKADSHFNFSQARREGDKARQAPCSPLPDPEAGFSEQLKPTVVKTIIEDENGKVLESSVKKIPTLAPKRPVPKASPLKPSQTPRKRASKRAGNDFKASSSFNRSISFSSLRKKHAAKPKKEDSLAEFRYLVDTIFEKNDLTSARHSSHTAKAKVTIKSDPKTSKSSKTSKTSKSVREAPVTPKRSKQTLSTYRLSIDLSPFSDSSDSSKASNFLSLDPKQSSPVKALEALGIRTPATSIDTPNTTVSSAGQKRMSSSSSRNLASLLQTGKTLSISDYNRSQSNKQFHLAVPETSSWRLSRTTGDYNLPFSVHSAMQVPISTTSQVHLADKYADADEAVVQKNLIDDPVVESKVKAHRKADSMSTQNSQPYPEIRCSVMAGDAYDLPEDGGRELNLTPEKKERQKQHSVTKRDSVFADPDDDAAIVNKENVTIFDEENNVDSKLLDQVTELPRRNTRAGILSRVSAAGNRASSLFKKTPDLSPLDPVLSRGHRETIAEETEPSVERPGWFRKILTVMTPNPTKTKKTVKRKKTKKAKSHVRTFTKTKNLLSVVINEYYIETDYLTSKEAIEFLLGRENRRTNMTIQQSPEDGKQLLCSFGDKTIFRVDFEDQIGGRYGFGGCFIKIAKLQGNSLTFNRCCKVIDQNLQLLDHQKEQDI